MGQINLPRTSCHLGQEVIQDHQPPGPGIAELVGHFLGAEQRVQRHHHRAQAQGGMIGHHELGTIGEQEGQALTRGQTLAFEGLGQPGRLVRELPVGEDPAEEDQGRGLRGLGRGVEQQPGQGGRGRLHG